MIFNKLTEYTGKATTQDVLVKLEGIGNKATNSIRKHIADINGLQRRIKKEDRKKQLEPKFIELQTQNKEAMEAMEAFKAAMKAKKLELRVDPMIVGVAVGTPIKELTDAEAEAELGKFILENPPGEMTAAEKATATALEKLEEELEKKKAEEKKEADDSAVQKPNPTVAPPKPIDTNKAVANILAKKVAGKDKKLEKMFKLYRKYLSTPSLTSGGSLAQIARAANVYIADKQAKKAVVDKKITDSIVNNGFILGVTDAEKALTSGYEHAEYANYKGFESNLLKLITTNPDYATDIKTILARFKADELKYITKIMEKINTNPPALILDDKVKILMSGLDASSKLEKDIIKLFNRTKAVDAAGAVTYPFDDADGKPFDKSEYITHCKFIVLFNKLDIADRATDEVNFKYIFPDLTDGPQKPTFDTLISNESNYLQTKATEYEKDKSPSPVIEAINLIVTTLDVDKDDLVGQLNDYKQIYWAEAEFTTKAFEENTMYDLVDDRLAYKVSFFDLIEGRLKVIQAGEIDSPPEVKSAATVVLKDFSKRISNSPNKGKILSAIKSARNFTKKNRYEVDEGIYKKLEKITNTNGKIQASKDNLIATIKDGNKTKIEEDTNALLKALNDRKVHINTLGIGENKKEIEADPSMSETDKFAKNRQIDEFKKEVQELDVNIAEVTSILSDKGIKDKNKRFTLRNIHDKIVDKFTKQKTIVPGVSPDTTPIPDFDVDDTTYIVKPFKRKVDTDKDYVRIEIEGTSVKVGGERITTTAEWNEARKSILGLKPQQDVKLPSFDGKIVFDVYQNGKITVRMNNGETTTINNEAQLEAFKETDMKVKTLAAASKGYMSKATKGIINKVGSVFSKKTPGVVPSGAPSATVVPAPAPSTTVAPAPAPPAPAPAPPGAGP